MTTFTRRIILSAKLNPEIYEEVEADKGAFGQAMGVVVLASLAAGIGSLRHIGIGGLLLGTLSALVGWLIWSYAAYFIGTRFLAEPQTRATYGELLRTIGFASAPGIIRILGLIPELMAISFAAAEVWMLVAMVVAIRQALDYNTIWRAVAVCLIGWGVQALLIGIVYSIFGGAAAPPQ
ncbi:MAG: hypothetical protein P8X90_07175 [Desulfobacterales bacterium]|jgi:hypothetical protein